MTDKPKAIIVDDDQTVHSILKFIFEKIGFQVFSAMDSIQGLTLIKHHKPRIIILDIMMPAGGGLTLHGRLKQLKDLSDIPTLIYSALSRSEIEHKIDLTDKIEILTKPSTPDKIMSTIKTLCEIS